MAILNDLIVHGATRCLNKAWFSDLDISGNTVITGSVTASGRSSFSGGLNVGYTNTSYLLSANSLIVNSWIRTNGATGWYNESYGGGWYMTDANYIRNYNKPVLLSQPLYMGNTTYYFKNDGVLNAASVGAATGSITTLNTGTLNSNNVNVRGILKSEQWDIQHITQVGGTMALTPSFTLSSSATVIINSISGTTVDMTINDPTSIASDTIGGAVWSAGSQVKIAGRLGNVVIGTSSGTVTTKMNTTAGTLRISVTIENASELTTGTYSAANVHNVSAMLYSVGDYPVGIRMSSYDVNKSSSIDIYGGTAGSVAHNYWYPNVRIGKLDGMLDSSGQAIKINGESPTGWGLFTNNGYFEGMIVSNSGKIGKFTISDALYTTAKALGTTDNNVYIGDDGISLGKTFKVTKAGAITSTSGTIGGFTLSSNSIIGGTWGASGGVMVCTGTSSSKAIGGSASINGWAFTAGAKFGVTTAGVVYASDVHLTGSITATSGSIAGWRIESTYLASGTSTAPAVDVLLLSPSGTSSTYSVAGQSKSGWMITAGTTFGVNKDGGVYATSGKIGGWTIDSSKLYSGTHSTWNSTAEDGVYLGNDGIAGGNGGIWYLWKDGSAKIGAMTLSADGVLTVPAANVSGQLTAATIDASKIDSGTISAARIGAHTITTDKLVISDLTNYCQINEYNAATYGWTYTADSSNPNTPWYVRQTLARDNYPSEWFECKPGDMFKVSMTASSSVKGATASGGSADTYMTINIGINCQTADGTNLWPTHTIVTSSAAATETTATGYIKVPTDKNYVRFRAFIQIGGVAPFTGSLKIRNPVIKRVGADEYITYINSTDGIKVHNANDTNNYVQINSNGVNLYQNNTSVAFYGATARIGKSSTARIEIDSSPSINLYNSSNKLALSVQGSGLLIYDQNGYKRTGVTSSGFVIYDGASSTTTTQLASFGSSISLASNEATVTIGSTSKYHTVLSSTAMEFKNGANTNKTLMSISGNQITLYKSNTTTAAAVLSSTGLSVEVGTFGNATKKISVGTGTSGNSAMWYEMTTLDSTADGFYIGTDGIALGGGKFKVTNAGSLTATSGSISGSIVTTGIDAANISTGYLAAARINTGTLAFDKLTSAAQTQIQGYGKTATDYLTFTAGSGLVVGSSASSAKVQILSNGVHILDQNGKERNLIDANGMTIKNTSGVTLSSFTDSGVLIYDGNGSEDSNIVARFGSTATIGKSNNSHISLSENSFIFYDKLSNPFLKIEYLDEATSSTTITKVNINISGTGTTTHTLTSTEKTAYNEGRLLLSVTYSPRIVEYADVFDVSSSGVVTIGFEAHGNTTIQLVKTLSTTQTIATTSFTYGVRKNTKGSGSIVLGNNCEASGKFSLAEGWSTIASNSAAHAEGFSTTASGQYSHAEGNGSTASGNFTHAEGSSCTAGGTHSHAQGLGTIANGFCETAIGQYNVATLTSPASTFDASTSKYILVAGKGTSSTRSNAMTLDWSGNLMIAGSLSMANSGTTTSITVGSSSNATKAISFSGFTSAPHVIATLVGVSSTTHQLVVSVSDIKATGATINIRNNGTAQRSAKVSWIAIG